MQLRLVEDFIELHRQADALLAHRVGEAAEEAGLRRLVVAQLVEEVRDHLPLREGGELS